MTIGQEIRMNILILGQFADIVTTVIGIEKFGMREVNPIMKWAFNNLGYTNAAILKLAVALYISRKGVGSFSCALTWMAPINNLIGMLPQ